MSEAVALHELGITQSVVDAVLQAVDEQQVVRRLELEIGKLSGVLPDSVRFCFDLIASGTALDGACLEIIEPPGWGACGSCGAEFELADLLLRCRCGSSEVVVLTGLELRVKAVEVE